MFRNSCFAFVVMLLAPLIVHAQEHPLLTRYPGSRVESNTSKEFAQYKLVTAFDQKTNAFSGPTLEGKVTRLVYGNPAQRSPLEIFRNYQSALAQAGMEILFQCAGEQCGPTFSTSAWNRYNGVMAFSGKDSHYLAGKLKTANAEAFVALMVGKQRTQIDIVERKAMDTGLVTINAQALAASIAREGRVSIYGIYFDTGKAALQPESKPALDEIALLLQQKPELKLHVVGHTDNTGTFAANLQLSKDRAAAVVAAFTNDYAIAATRLAAHGVGPLAPAATNATEEGRGKNRRVELVSQ